MKRFSLYDLFVIIAVVAICAACPITAQAEFDAITTQFVDSTTDTNTTDRGYQIDSVWVNPALSTSQVLTFSVTVGGVKYDQKTLTVAGDHTWTANQAITVPAAGILTIASDQSVTNDVYIQRSEVSSNQLIVSGELADDSVNVAHLNFTLSDISPTGDDGGSFKVVAGALVYISSGGVTNQLDADITAE